MIRGLRQAFSGFFTHQGFFLAAGLSFYFLICLVPLLFLVVSLAGFILSGEAATRQILDQLSQIVPVYQKEVTRTLDRIVATRQLSGLLGTLILILFSTQLFAALRFVLNRILGVRGRSFWRGMLFDIGMIFVIGILFLATIAATAVFAWFKSFVFKPAGVPAQWVEWMSIALGVSFSTAMYFVIYRFFPHRRIFWGAALAGALLTSVLWELAKHLLRLYIVELGLYDQIYGPLGVLVAFIMFVYYSAVVFVLGAELVAALERGSASRR
ncbi:MAG: YihY/virulence factor BrkB family protein [Candidatus Rokubacteria bacterium]|nr:YihY/virulence factor BrkB family protein [Candidatus Rokubacteria bacterium]